MRTESVRLTSGARLTHRGLTKSERRKLGAALARPSSSGASRPMPPMPDVNHPDSALAFLLGTLILGLMEKYLGPKMEAEAAKQKNAERQRKFRARRAARKK